MSDIIPYAKHDLTEADKKAVLDAMESSAWTQGPRVLEFEKAVTDYVKAKHCVAVTNGTAALHLGVLSLERFYRKNKSSEKKKKVISTPITFAASTNCALYANLEPHFIDIESESACIDIEKTIDYIKKNHNLITGVVPVSFGGLPLNLKELYEICQKHGIWIMEDSCHALGAWRQDPDQVFASSCKYSDASILSFHPAKHIACGEGGMLLTQHQEVSDTASLLRTHGIQKNIPGKAFFAQEMIELGFNYRISDILCALGIAQLKRIEENINRRNEIALKYRKELVDSPLKPIQDFDYKNIRNAYHLFVARCPSRDLLYTYLREHKVYCQLHYTPIYKHPYYKQNFSILESEFSNSEKYYSEALSFPMYPSLKDEEQDFVISKIKAFYASSCN